MSQTVAHFWVGRSQRFSPSLVVIDRPVEMEASISKVENIDIELFDQNGNSHTTASLEYPRNSVGYISLEPFLLSLPVEQGMQFGHMIVRSESAAKCMVRWNGESMKEFSTSPRVVKPREPVFFPLYINDSFDHILLLVNPTSETVNYTVRLFAGQRSPEITLEIPPMASSAFSIAHEFWTKIRDLNASGALQSYVRVSINQTGSLAVHLLESSSDSRLRLVS